MGLGLGPHPNLVSIAALAHVYGMAAISATTGVEAAGTIWPMSMGILVGVRVRVRVRTSSVLERMEPSSET